MAHHWIKSAISKPTTQGTGAAAKTVYRVTIRTKSKPSRVLFSFHVPQKGLFKNNQAKKILRIQLKSVVTAMTEALNLLTAPE